MLAWDLGPMRQARSGEPSLAGWIQVDRAQVAQPTGPDPLDRAGRSGQAGRELHKICPNFIHLLSFFQT